MINNNRIEALKLYKNDLDKLIQRESKRLRGLKKSSKRKVNKSYQNIKM